MLSDKRFAVHVCGLKKSMPLISNNSGNIIVYVLGLLIVSSVLMTTMFTGIQKQMDSENKMTNADVFDVASNALLDYVVVSVKNQWCVDPYWIQKDCNGKELIDDKSIRRMLMSENNILSLGDYFIRNVVELKTEPINNYPACAASLNYKPSNSQLSTWKTKWLNCIRIGADSTAPTPTNISEAIPKLTSLPSSHPLAKLFDTPIMQNNDIGKAIITVNQVGHSKQFPRSGRDVVVEVKIEVYSEKDNKLQKISKSVVEVVPAQLNHFGLVLAGDLFMNMESYPGDNVKGGYIPLAKDHDEWPGINFESPVYIDGNIRIPDENKKDYSSFVRFNSNVYMSSNTSTTNEEGSICQGTSSNGCNKFVSTPSNRLTNYMRGFLNGVDHMFQDKGIEYIAGPVLAGKADGDSSRGGTIQTCADFEKAQTDLRFTKDNSLVVLKDPALSNQYTLMWANNGSNQFSLKNLNRFATPRNDIDRGEGAKCYKSKTADERIMRPHIYNNNGGLKIQGRKYKNSNQAVQTVPAYTLFTSGGADITETAASLQQDLLIKSPMAEFDSDSGKEVRNTLKKCPKDKVKDQLDALDGEFKEKAAAVVNAEYKILLKDNNKVQTTLNNQMNALKPEDISQIKPTMYDANKTGIIDYLNKIIPLAGQLYTAKALMAVNTKLIFQGVKDGMIATLLEEADPNIAGTYANIAKIQLKDIEDKIKSILGISDISQEGAAVARIQKNISDLNTQLSNTPPTIQVARESCSSSTSSTGTTTQSCSTYYTTETNPAYTSLQSQISALQNQLNSYYYQVARRSSIQALSGTLASIKDDLIDLIGTDGLGRSLFIEEVPGIKYQLNGGQKEFFSPNLLKMRINLPKITNQFVAEFSIIIDAFDPSYIYTQKAAGSEAQCSSMTRPGVVGVWALTTSGSRVCLELKSRRLDQAGVFPNPDYNVFKYEFKKSSSGLVTSNIIPSITTDGAQVDAKLSGYKSFAMTKHPGFLEFKCKVTAAKVFVPNAAQGQAEDTSIDLDGEHRLSESSSKVEDFSAQTNHSWHFSSQDPFMDVANLSYNPNYDMGLLDITTNTTGPEFPVKSIMSRCLIHRNVTFVAGFYVCRELVIEGGRNKPLDLSGTFIVGRLVIPDSSIAQYGLYFRNVFHQASVDAFRAVNLLETEAKCYGGVTQPVWYGNLSLKNQSILDRCTPKSFTDEAQAFSWNMVDPDCGIINKYAKSGNKAVMTERMACKDEIKRYFILEKGRGQL